MIDSGKPPVHGPANLRACGWASSAFRSRSDPIIQSCRSYNHTQAVSDPAASRLGGAKFAGGWTVHGTDFTGCSRTRTPRACSRFSSPRWLPACSASPAMSSPQTALRGRATAPSAWTKTKASVSPRAPPAARPRFLASVTREAGRDELRLSPVMPLSPDELSPVMPHSRTARSANRCAQSADEVRQYPIYPVRESCRHPAQLSCLLQRAHTYTAHRSASDSACAI